MYSYVYQKLTLGKERETRSISWNNKTDIVALGFDNNTIKLLKFDEPENYENEIQLSMNQNISSNHKSSISVLSWNEKHDKLLSVDENGLMVIWIEDNDKNFVEEMVNEAGKRRIKFAKWSNSGSYVVIIIEGGELILGSVDGERLWNQKMSNDIEKVAFIENDNLLILRDVKGMLYIVDSKIGETISEYELIEGNSKIVIF